MTVDLPPEAFTKKTLQEACSWLESQSEELRTIIHTPEKLVSLYQKSKRLEGRIDFVKSEKFVNGLKSLTSRKSSEDCKSDSVDLEKNETSVVLDPLSKKRVEEVQKRFNLTSYSEALRLLVSLGFEKFMQFQ